MGKLRQFLLQDFKYVPQWIKLVQLWYLRRRFVRHMMKAQATGASITEEWFPPETEPDTVFMWIDNQFATAPRVMDSDIFVVVVGPCSYASWHHPTSGIHADDDSTMWMGTRTGWWQDGRDHIATALLLPHPGLYVGVNATSKLAFVKI